MVIAYQAKSCFFMHRQVYFHKEREHMGNSRRPDRVLYKILKKLWKLDVVMECIFLNCIGCYWTGVSPRYYKVKVTWIFVFHYKLLLHDKILILNQYEGSSTTAAMQLGSLPFQSPMFVQYFKVLKETHIQMALALITMQL